MGFGDVWSLARKPTNVLRQLLSPEDIIKLGSTLRTRTTHLFEGIFEPAAKRPADPATPPGPEAPKPDEPAEQAKPRAE